MTPFTTTSDFPDECYMKFLYAVLIYTGYQFILKKLGDLAYMYFKVFTAALKDCLGFLDIFIKKIKKLAVRIFPSLLFHPF